MSPLQARIAETLAFGFLSLFVGVFTACAVLFTIGLADPEWVGPASVYAALGIGIWAAIWRWCNRRDL